MAGDLPGTEPEDVDVDGPFINDKDLSHDLRF